MIEAQLLIPEIDDVDVDNVAKVLGLDDFDTPRREFLKLRRTVDISACPGSGKTTLIVAKLGILAAKWSHQTKGICVLSHTNAAREQIESRLGKAVGGQRLLGYPHFIDTIHGFVNRFLALPWLYSNGYPAPTIDDDVTNAYRRSVLGKDYFKVQAFLSNKHSDFDKLRLCGRDMSFDLGGKPFPAQPSAPSFQHAKRAIGAAAQAGYFCYDEMFVWANALLQDHPEIPDWLARRFPLVILDEMQDTFELQASILDAVFPRNSAKIVVQRVGDPNQRIFDADDSSSGSFDPFPDTTCCVGIPNSYRFGPDIGTFASPFAVDPVGPSGLCGIGPRGQGASARQCRHAIFVFPDNSTEGILESYGRYVLEELGQKLATNGPVAAVGHIHQDHPDVKPGHSYYPKTVSHYWDRYTAAISRRDAHPRTFVEYVRLAQGMVSDDRMLLRGVDKVASAIIELARRIGDTGDLKHKGRTHRTLAAALAYDFATLAMYREVLKDFLLGKVALSESDWESHKDRLAAIAAALCNGGTDPSNAKPFLAWPTDETGARLPGNQAPNVFHFSDERGSVDIRLGTIHSVKGQTHVATLLLSTNWFKYQSATRTMPCLLGKKKNGAGAGKQDRQRLLHAYVAMTRPSHLLALAVPRSALGGEQDIDETAAELMGRGWRIAELKGGLPVWRN